MPKSTTLTSRERVLRAINHQEADRVPIDLGSHTASGISAFAYWDLRVHLGLSTDNIRIADTVQQLAYVDPDILERFHCDCVMLEPSFRETQRWNPRGAYTFSIPAAARPERIADGGWIVRLGDASMRMPPGGFFFDGASLNNWGEGAEEDRLSLYAREAERIYKETEYATIMAGACHGLGMANYGGGSLDDAILAFDEPEQLHARRKQNLAASIHRMGKIIDAFGPFIQIVRMSDDMGSQNGVLCSPDYVEEFCLPYYQRFCEFVHTNSDIKVMLHSCGAIRRMIPGLVHAGIDVLNPVQISAADMDPQGLKDTFGDRICFWGGGCDTQGVLCQGKPGQVADHVQRLVGIFKPRGGFVFNQVHNVMGDVPPENIVAMLDSAYAASFY